MIKKQSGQSNLT